MCTRYLFDNFNKYCYIVHAISNRVLTLSKILASLDIVHVLFIKKNDKQGNIEQTF